jgi:hypothetical protein
VLWDRARRSIRRRSTSARCPIRRIVDEHLDHPEALVQSAAQSEEAFKQFVEETASAADLRQSGVRDVLQRERAARSVSRALFRGSAAPAERSVGAAREHVPPPHRSAQGARRARGPRERDVSLDDTSPQVGVAWGQALYNITSGRPAAVSDGASTVREVDYLENIAQIQRAWDKELETLRDELMASARSIEEIEVSPAAKNIEITKYLILWATSLP